MLAFEGATRLGVDLLEFDVHASRDGVLVVIHDDTVDRTTDGSGAVADLTLAQLQALDAGHDWSPERAGETFPYRGQGVTIPTLDEVLAAFPEMPMVLELKPDSALVASQMWERLRAADKTQEAIVGSFHGVALRAFRRACPEVATSATPTEVRASFMLGRAFLAAAYTPPTEAFQVPEYSGNLHVVSERFVQSATAKGIEVQVWTVNEHADMRRLIDLGARGIITDRPDRALRELGREVDLELLPGVPE